MDFSLSFIPEHLAKFEILKVLGKGFVTANKGTGTLA